MRRIAVVILFTVFITSFCISASAVGAVTAEVISDNAISAGAEEEFVLCISNAQNVRTISITPKYSGDVFEFVSGRWLVAGVLADVGVDTGSASIAFNSGTDVKGNIFSFTLKVKIEAQGEQAVGCEIAITYDDGTAETVIAEESKTVVGCNHVYTQKILKAPSDVEAGIAEYVCVVCGSSHKAILPPVKTGEESIDASEIEDLSVDISEVSETVSQDGSESASSFLPVVLDDDNSDKTALVVAIAAMAFGGACILIFLRKRKHTR